MAWHPFRVLVDSSENELKVSQDGSDYKLDIISKVRNAAGTIVSLATEATLSTISGTLTAIKDTAGIKKIVDALPVGANVIGKVVLRNPGDTLDIGDATNPVRTDPTGTTTQPISASSLPLPAGAATESTLSAADAKLGTIDSVLDSIKDTDGIKKITDPLPAGTNNIGDVDVVSSALPAGAATESTLNGISTKVGEVQATPTANTVLDRLKQIQDVDFATETTQATLATEVTADAIRDNIGEATASPAADTVQDRLKDVQAKLATIDAVLDSIKDTDGVKKITDPLPAGTNNIGDVDVVSSALPAGAATEATLASVIGTAGSPAANVVSIQGVTNGRAVQVTTVASAADAIVTEFLKNGTSEDMVVDGSTTPVEFVFNADPTIDIRLNQLRLVLVADTISLGTDVFGKLGGALANGILIEATINDGTNVAISTMTRNEDLLRLSSTDIIFAGNKDLVVGSVQFSGEELLVHGTSDKIKITIQDNLTLAQRAIWYFTATFYGSG